jgi:hypothetical protein
LTEQYIVGAFRRNSICLLDGSIDNRLGFFERWFVEIERRQEVFKLSHYHPVADLLGYLSFPFVF